MNNALLLAVGMFTGMLVENPQKRAKTVEITKNLIKKVNKVAGTNESVQTEEQSPKSS